MAIVYRALDQQTGQTVAVKALSPETQVPDPHQRFEREIRMLETIQHPHCIRLLDAGTDPIRFAVLELINGVDLRDALDEALPATQALELSLQLLRGLQQVHAHGMVHRDIKAENIVMSRWADGTDRLVLVDFGAAVHAGAAGHRSADVLTAIEQVLGTPSLMGPEQLCGMPATERSDLYAVGAVMYEMLVGEAAFLDGDFTELLEAKTDRVPHVPDFVPPTAAWLIRSLLAPVPEDRPETCAEAIEAVMYARDVLRQSEATTTWIDLLGSRPRR